MAVLIGLMTPGSTGRRIHRMINATAAPFTARVFSRQTCLPWDKQHGRDAADEIQRQTSLPAKCETGRVNGGKMVIGLHVVFCVYGFWLPNDPRGSWSDFVGGREIFKYGPATKTDTRRSVAGTAHDRGLRLNQKKGLKYPPVRLSERQIALIGDGFARACEEWDYVFYACSILPEHVHLVVRQHSRPTGRIVGHLKARATRSLVAAGIWKRDKRPLWSEGHWKVFLNTPEDVTRAIRYVESNLEKKQRWQFVAPFI